MIFALFLAVKVTKAALTECSGDCDLFTLECHAGFGLKSFLKMNSRRNIANHFYNCKNLHNNVT